MNETISELIFLKAKNIFRIGPKSELPNADAHVLSAKPCL
jgi:hypothetical protein